MISLSTTYRFNDIIADYSSSFILRNENQLNKNVFSDLKTDRYPFEIIHLPFSENLELVKEKAIIDIIKRIQEYDPNSELKIAVLARYKFCKPKNYKHIQKQFPKYSVYFDTVHSSKGTEAEYVILTDLTSGKYGFPSQIADDPVLDVLISKPEDFPNAEERRLFYVAMTRAKKKVFFLTNTSKPSTFIIELESFLQLRIDCENHNCSGKLRPKLGNDGLFLGCTNYPDCRKTKQVDKDHYVDLYNNAMDPLPF